jgi:hypothetical protein
VTASELALGAALHFDAELAADPQPFARLVETLADGATHLVRWSFDLKNRPREPAPLDFARLPASIKLGRASIIGIQTPRETPAAERLLVEAYVAPRTARPERFVQTRCRYDAIVGLGHARATEDAVAAIVAFADAVAARAGVVHWATTPGYADALASFGGHGTLTAAQIAHITDMMYWQPRWGDVIRGPAWGTFVNAAHVATLGGIARVERDAPCARVVALASGGAFLQATPAACAEPDVPLGELAAFLAPVMGHR